MDRCVDVIIPAYNAEKYVATALRSLESESTFINQIIVIDDCSLDDTVAAIIKAAPQSIVIRNNVRRGVSAARNIGINAATAKWIAFLDSDDQWKPGKLAKQIMAAEEYNCDLIATASAGEHLSDYGEISLKKLLRKNTIYTSSVLIRRQLLETHSLRFDEDLTFAEDYLMWIRTMLVGKGLVINEPLVFYRKSPSPNYSIHAVIFNVYKVYFRIISSIKMTRNIGSRNSKNRLYGTALIGLHKSLGSIAKRFASSLLS